MLARRTRIVATLGPASDPPAVLDALLRAGVDVCRLNCSHSHPDGIRREIRSVREAAERVGRNVAILLDLQGPKIRTGAVAIPLELETGDELVIAMSEEVVGAGRRIGTTFPSLADNVSPGDPLVFADGELAGHVKAVNRSVTPVEVVVVMENGGLLGAHKGINLPGVPVATPSLTEKDLADLEAGIQAGVDYVALSFVRRAQDVDDLHAAMARLGHPDVPVCAKIEKPQALDDLQAILERVDAIMVARGDLGVEMPISKVPLVQKRLIRAANQAGVLVITATQMLDSMQEHPRPTRAEVTDVANAILDGTDAVMLSGETAAGRYPVECVRTMDEIARETEASPFFLAPSLDDVPHFPGIGGTVSRAACWAVRDFPRPLVVFTWSGNSAVAISKSRPSKPIFALSPNPAVVRRLALAWGVTPILIPRVEESINLVQVCENTLLEAGLVVLGDEVVIVSGKTPCRGSTNTMTVEIVGPE